MHFTGLPSATLLPLGIVAGLLIVGLYILKLRRRPVPVPFANLWKKILRDKEATSLFSQLKRIFSLLLQLLLLALLLLALGDPRGAIGASHGRSIVVLVDASASMKAIDLASPLAPNRTRLDAAKEEVQKLVQGLGGSDRMLVAQMDAAVTPLSTMTGELPDLAAAVSSIVATDAPADFARALRFGSDVVRGLPDSEIIVVSDGNLGPPRDSSGDVHTGNVKVTFLPIGRRGKNLGITQFTVRRYPFDRDRYEVMLELYNAQADPEEVELTLLGDGNVVDVTKLRLGPGEKLPRFYPNLSGAKRTLEAQIKLANGEHDDLPADDRAYALLPDQRHVRVLCVTSGNTYLEAALLLTSYLDVTYLAPGAYGEASGKTYDVTIFDGVAPPAASGAGSILYLDPSGPDSPVAVDAELANVGFDTLDKKSPLLKWTAIDDVYIGKAHRLKPQPGDRVLGASDRGSLLVSGRRGGHRFVALGFDPRESDLVLRMAWPIFLLNTLRDFAAEDSEYLSSFRTGEVWHIPLPVPAESAILKDPEGRVRRIPVQEGRAVFLGQSAGYYTLSVGTEGAETRTEFAANVANAEESSMAPQSSLLVDGREAGPAVGFHVGVRSEWWIALLLAAVVLTSLEWVTFHRRVTV